MTKFVGIKANSIHIVSDKEFSNSNLKVLQLPQELNHLSPEELITSVKYLNNEFKYKFAKKPIKDLKIAFVSNFAMQCGISSYSSFLYKELIPQVKDFRLLIEDHDSYLDSIYHVGNEEISHDKVIPCWKRGEKLDLLVEEIKKFNPDIVLIQHEFGLWSNARYWISLLNQLSNYRVIVTMHSVFHHKDKAIVEAPIPEIVVHLEGAKEVLKEEKKISSKVHVIPHGCFPCEDPSKLWNFYKSNNTFIQAGFLFRYKGFENSIKAAALLKNKYPDVYFTAICSEGPFSKIEHEIYYNELVELVNSLGLQNNVGFIRGYQSDFIVDAYIRTNKAAVLPYVSSTEHECFGASGFGPFVMSKGIPLITSEIHHFSNLPTLKAKSPEDIAMYLDQLFSSNELVEKQIAIQNQYLIENSWANVAKKYISIFEN